MGYNLTLGCMNRPWASFTFDRALTGIQTAGFTEFGLLRHQGRALITPDMPPQDVETVTQAVRRVGLRMVMLANSVALHRSDGEAVAAMKRQIDHCRRLDVPILLEMGYSRPEGYSRYFEVMRHAAPYAEQQGVVIALKPHGGLSMTSADTLAAVRRVNHPSYRICYDPGNLLRTGGEPRPQDYLPELMPYVVAMCIKDATSGPSGTPLVTPGDGEVDFPAVFRILRDHGFAGPAVLETLAETDTPEATDAEAKRAFQFLRNVLATL